MWNSRVCRHYYERLRVAVTNIVIFGTVSWHAYLSDDISQDDVDSATEADDHGKFKQRQLTESTSPLHALTLSCRGVCLVSKTATLAQCSSTAGVAQRLHRLSAQETIPILWDAPVAALLLYSSTLQVTSKRELTQPAGCESAISR